MSDNNTTTTTTKEKRRPDFAAYSVRERKDQKSTWTEIGVAFAHKDGNGFDILMHVTPLNGKVVLRKPTSKS